MFIRTRKYICIYVSFEQRKELLLKSQQFRGRKRSKAPDLDDIDEVETSVVDLPSHTVTVSDISEIDLAGHSGLRLGINKVPHTAYRAQAGH